MKAEDTVMNEDQKDWYSLCKDGVSRHHYDEPFLTDILTAQAEITWDIAFKAGRKAEREWAASNQYRDAGLWRN